MKALLDDIQAVVASQFNQTITPTLTRPDSQFGDYSTNIAMQLAGKLQQNPRQIAELVAAELRQTGNYDDITVAGPGFINVCLKPAALLAAINQLPAKPYHAKKIVFEYSCPNAFKELHTGHLYQTIYGDIVSRLLELGGANLQRTSFGGDVGLHVAKCVWGMVKELGGANPSALENVSSDVFERARWISKCYVTGASAYEADESAKIEIDNLNKTIYQFHSKNNNTRQLVATQPDYETDAIQESVNQTGLEKIYWQTRQWSLDYFTEFYNMIEVVNMPYYAESQTAPVGLAIVKEQLTKGNLEESDGAVVFRGDETKHLHTRVFVTRQGLPTYETKDIGVIWLEKQDYNFEHRYLLTGNDQKDYMRVVFAAAETFRPELAGKMTHLTNGTVRFADGKKMSSRLGNVSRAADVIELVRQRVAEMIEDEALIETVTLGAIKYAFARYKLGGDINFNINETVSLQGNSGPYLQYAHARAQRILEKATQPGVDLMAELDEVYDEDRALVYKLGEYHEVLDKSIASLEPHYICNYLFELAQEFNRYYEANQVIGHARQTHRARLVAVYAKILKQGLNLLGIAAPNNM